MAGGAQGGGQKETCAQVPATGVLCAHLGQPSFPHHLWKGFEEGPSFEETLSSEVVRYPKHKVIQPKCQPKTRWWDEQPVGEIPH